MTSAAFRRTARTTLIWMGSILAVPLAMVAILALVQGYWLLTATSEGDVTRMIEENLPIGASVDEIDQFLDRKGIEHSDVGDSRYESRILDQGYPTSTLNIVAILPNTSRTFFCEGSIQIYFILDEAKRLTEYLVEEGGTCP